MSDTAQIVLTRFMIGFVIDGFYWAVKKQTAATIWMIGMALLVGMVIF